MKHGPILQLNITKIEQLYDQKKIYDFVGITLKEIQENTMQH